VIFDLAGLAVFTSESACLEAAIAVSPSAPETLSSCRKKTATSPVPSSANPAAGSNPLRTLAAVSFARIAPTPVATLAAKSHASCDQDHTEERIGTGIFAKGRIVRGKGGLTEEFGHAQMEPNGLECSCGNRGCWETVASNRAGMRYYRKITNEHPRSFDVLLKLAVSGDPARTAAIDRMCIWLGRGMQMIGAALARTEIEVVGVITPHL
jgi:hypothetical protein